MHQKRTVREDNFFGRRAISTIRVDGLGRSGALPSQLRLCFPSFKADEKWPTFQDQQLNKNNRIHSDGNNKNVSRLNETLNIQREI